MSHGSCACTKDRPISVFLALSIIYLLLADGHELAFAIPGIKLDLHSLVHSLALTYSARRQEVVFALYARESDGHSLVASLLVPLDQLFSGLPFRAWVQLVCIDGDVDSGYGIL